MRREKTRTVFRMIVLLLLAVISMVAMSQDMSCTRSNAYELALLKEQCLVEFAPIVVDKATPGDELMDEDADDDEEELGLDSKVDFASEAAGGKIVASSKGMEMPGNILKSNLDKYLMVPCEEPVKHIVLQLPDDLKVTHIALANLEHYASSFKHIEVMGSERYPTKYWILLANLTMAIGPQAGPHAEQVFEVTDQAWVRYIKLRFLDHAGSQHYCTLTSLRVFGLRVLEVLKQEISEPEPAPSTSEPIEDDPASVPTNSSTQPVSNTTTSDPPTQSPSSTGGGILQKMADRISKMEQVVSQSQNNVYSKLTMTLETVHEWTLQVEDLVSEHHRDIQVTLSALSTGLNMSAMHVARTEAHMHIIREHMEGIKDSMRAMRLTLIAIAIIGSVVGIGLVALVLWIVFGGQFLDRDMSYTRREFVSTHSDNDIDSLFSTEPKLARVSSASGLLRKRKKHSKNKRRSSSRW